MINGRRSAILISLSALLVVAVGLGCAASRPIGDGSSGAKIYRARCRSCHALYEPTRKSLEWWQANLDKYAKRAHLKPAERDSVMSFVTRMTTGL